MTDVAPSSDSTVFDQLLAEDTDRRMHYGALYYAQHGIPVFPINIITDDKGKIIKKPAIKSWPSDATTNPTVINSWWGSGGTHEGCLIGAVTGARSGWGVIDVDVKNGGKGLDSLQKLADELMPIKTTAEFAFGQLLPHERLAPVGLAQTRSGGLHLWYPLGEKSKTRGRNKIRGLPNLEFKATGHYVVVAPSDGYEWMKLIPTKKEWDWDVPISEYHATLPVIDDTLLTRLLDGGDSDDVLGGDGDEFKIIVQNDGARLLKSAVTTLMSTPDGEGNNTVYKLCCDLYPYVVLAELTKAQVDQAIWAGIRSWGADEGTIAGTMASAWKRTGERTIKFNVDMVPISSNGNGHHEAPIALAEWARSHGKQQQQQQQQQHNVVHEQPNEDIEEIKSVVETPSVPHDDAETTPVAQDDVKSFESAITELLPDHLRDDKIVTEIKALVNNEYKRSVARKIYQELSDVERSWDETDLGSEDTDPIPTILTTESGNSLLYPTEFNMLWGKASAGKSWLTALAILQQVRAGKHAVILDYENGRPRIRNRLRQVGLTMKEINQFVHVFISQIGGVPIHRLRFPVDEVGVVVIDSMTGALRAMDLDSLRGDDIEMFNQRLVVPFKEAGAAVLALDHVTKNGESDDRDRPINSVHKINMIQGTGHEVKNVVAFAPGTPGWSYIRLWKDNGGGTDKVVGENIGRLVVDGSHDRVRISISTDVDSIAVLSQANGASGDKVADAIELLEKHDVPIETSVKRSGEILREAGHSVGQSDLASAVKRRRDGLAS
jgi:hypothetical protein